jgi:ParB-like chromosome segregation protein Spo0J
MSSVTARAVTFGASDHDIAWSQIHSVAIKDLVTGDSPRLGGIDDVHVKLLVECGAELPPILVHRPTMRVIDGMHRLRAAECSGRDHVQVSYFDGDDDAAFMLAVERNIRHGLPLPLADRKAAAQRILASSAALSDRAIAAKTGLSDKTIAAIRARLGAEIPHLDRRWGRDGRGYPISVTAGRQRAAEAIAERPTASLREIASAAGVSPTVASGVRHRLSAGADGPRPETGSGRLADIAVKRMGNRLNAVPPGRRVERTARDADFNQAALEQLRRDPSIRSKEAGRELLRWLAAHAIGINDLPARTDVIPPHRLEMMGKLARSAASAWVEFARRLEIAQHQSE